MHRRTGVTRSPRPRLPALAAVCSLLVVLAARVAVAQEAALLLNGDFEAGPAGWRVSSDATVVVDDQLGGVAGPNAARVEAHVSGAVQLSSQWWTGSPVSAGASFRLDAWVLADDPLTSRVSAWLEFVDGDGQRIARGSTSMIAGEAPGFRLVTADGMAPVGAAFVRAVIEGVADAAGARFSVDAVSVTQVSAPPPVTPTLAPPVATATKEPSPAPTKTPTKTPSPTATKTPTPTPLPVRSTLHNGAFESGVEGWISQRGIVRVEPALAGAGATLVLEAVGASTAWVDQPVLVAPGEWYEARASLLPLRDVSAAWLRVAWYASSDGSGSQLSTVDSPLAGSAAVHTREITRSGAGTPVSTGAVRAPQDALSARVRVVLQPTGPAGAELAIDDVAFAGAAPPVVPTSTPVLPAAPGGAGPGGAAPAAPAPPIATGTPTRAAASGSTPSGGGAPTAPGSSIAGVDPGIVTRQGALRLTEVMPDPPASGRDGEYEWVELTNTGDRPVETVAMLLRDAHAVTPLPSVIVPAGASIVVAAPRAEVDADVRLSTVIGNGLGNAGDRVELLDADGVVVDRVEYGLGGELAAPPVGESIQRWFADPDGVPLAGVGRPSPGDHRPPPALSPMEEATTASAAGSGPGGELSEPPERQAEDELAWVLLLAIGGGALGGVAMQRLASARRSVRR